MKGAGKFLQGRLCYGYLRPNKGDLTLELMSGDKVIIDNAMLYWYPDLDVGDKLKLTIHDADRTYEKEVEIAAVGEYRHGLTNYDYLIMAKEAADKLCSNSTSYYFHVIADKNYDEALEDALNELVDASGRIRMRVWKDEYEQWDSALALTGTGCYTFLGSLAGYPLFRYAKSHGMFGITNYHYPVAAAVIISVTLLIIQILLAVVVAKSVKKASLIERIRFSE